MTKPKTRSPSADADFKYTFATISFWSPFSQRTVFYVDLRSPIAVSRNCISRSRTDRWLSFPSLSSAFLASPGPRLEQAIESYLAIHYDTLFPSPRPRCSSARYAVDPAALGRRASASFAIAQPTFDFVSDTGRGRGEHRMGGWLGSLTCHATHKENILSRWPEFPIRSYQNAPTKLHLWWRGVGVETSISCRALNRCEPFRSKIQAAAADETSRTDTSKEERELKYWMRAYKCQSVSACRRMRADWLGLCMAAIGDRWWSWISGERCSGVAFRG